MVVPEMLMPGGPHLNADLLAWCAAHLSAGASFQIGSVAMGIARDNELLAVVAFDNFRRSPTGNPVSIECSIAAASPRWASKGTIRAILNYPFCQLGVQRVTALVQETNTRSVRMLDRLGFVREGYVRQAFEDGSSMIVTGILREEARRWLGDSIDG